MFSWLTQKKTQSLWIKLMREWLELQNKTWFLFADVKKAKINCGCFPKGQVELYRVQHTFGLKLSSSWNARLDESFGQKKVSDLVKGAKTRQTSWADKVCSKLHDRSYRERIRFLFEKLRFQLKGQQAHPLVLEDTLQPVRHLDLAERGRQTTAEKGGAQGTWEDTSWVCFNSSVPNCWPRGEKLHSAWVGGQRSQATSQLRTLWAHWSVQEGQNRVRVFLEWDDAAKFASHKWSNFIRDKIAKACAESAVHVDWVRAHSSSTPPFPRRIVLLGALADYRRKPWINPRLWGTLFGSIFNR